MLSHLNAKDWAFARCVCRAARAAKPDQVWVQVPARQRFAPVALQWAVEVVGPCKLHSVPLTRKDREEFVCLASSNAELQLGTALELSRITPDMFRFLAGLHEPVQATVAMVAITRKPFPRLPSFQNLQHLVIQHGEGSPFESRPETADHLCFGAISQLQQLVTLHCKLHLSVGHFRRHAVQPASINLENMTQLAAVYLEPMLGRPQAADSSHEAQRKSFWTAGMTSRIV